MTIASVRGAIHRIDDWLCHGPVFCPDSGAIAGVTDEGGVVYWYGEIAGYYLAYLATLTVESSVTQKFAHSAARQVGRWLQTQWLSEPGLTRLYTDKRVDWRNNYVFAFDLAMILKGLTSAQHCGAGVWHGRQVAEFIKLKLADEHGSILAVNTKSPVPPKNTWSTSVDGHQLKAVAGLMAWGIHFRDRAIYNMGKHTMRHLIRDGICDWPHLPLHPRLYALEGLMLCGMAHPGSISKLIQSIIADVDIEMERTDVIAQLLRLALFAQIEDGFIDDLVARLLDSIDVDGSVVFRMKQADQEGNTWCAIFTRQALSFYNEVSSGRKLQHGMCI